MEYDPLAPTELKAAPTESQHRRASVDETNSRLQKSAHGAQLIPTSVTGTTPQQPLTLEIRGPLPRGDESGAELQEYIDEIVMAVAEDMNLQETEITWISVRQCDLTDSTNTLLEELLCNIPTVQGVTLTRCDLPVLFCMTVRELKFVRCQMREVHITALTRWVEGGDCGCRCITIVGEKVGAGPSGGGLPESAVRRLEEACQDAEVKLAIREK